MKVPLSWVREFVDVNATAEEIGKLMGVRGLALESLEQHAADVIMDFDVTANRPDLLCMAGIAREIAAAYRVPLKLPAQPAWKPDQSIPITIEEPELCGRYIGATADVTVGPSPQWMQDRLTACGIRPISNIVDITNYVMLEIGQPMHAFDLDKMRGGKVIVRRAKAGEKMTTLDGKPRVLSSEMLVIADADNAEDIGGVMGGAQSEIGPQTRRVVFEAAYFTPSQIRRTSKALGIKTEASTRFERGMDRTAPPRAITRALELMEQIGAGKRTGHITDVYPRPHTAKTLRLDRERIVGLLGMDVPDPDVTRILNALGFETVQCQAPASAGSGPAPRTAWDVIAPPFRVDIHRQVDLIEEVGRHHGFEHLPATFPGVEQAPPPSDPRIARDRRVRTALLGMGFSEAITFAFIERAAAEPYLDGRAPVALANPLSEKFAVMRPSLLPGLVDVLSHNRRHGRPDVRVFEIGTRFSPDGETRGAALAWMGLGGPDHWSGARRPVDFSDIKGVVEQLASLASISVTFAEVERPYLVRGRAAQMLINGTLIGVLGQLSPEVGEARDLPGAGEVYVAEINLDAVTAASPIETRRAMPLPRFPFVVRDVSILVDDTLSAATVRGTIRSAAQPPHEASAGQAPTLIDIREFDRYHGKGVPGGKVSLSYRLTFQSPERTLTDAEVSEAMAAIIDALKRTHGAEQR
ncbi:MAG TPA: phenylalanine--tRNA ligase subunit beta [Vicinamibacterales bacterium]|nr:phenylalanine--tRNA ligase subunit beta [Vicinamibacterales bacterium]